jgi:short-subunit dehydrogenase
MSKNVSPRTLITGASSGIGRAIALQTARRGMRVHAVARRERELARLCEEIAAFGGRATFTVFDVSRTDAWVEELRRLDDADPIERVVANAGVGAGRGGASYGWEAVAQAFHTNVCGALATLTALSERFVARRRGHLVGIGSLASLGALPEALAYCAPKAALRMALECLALDLRPFQVDVTEVRIGFVATPMVAESTHPMPQLMSAERAAERIVDAFESRPQVLALPEPLASITQLFGAAPRALRRLVLSRVRGVG